VIGGLFRILVTGAFLSANTWPQLPEGPGKVEVQKLCVGCHELDRSISKRQDRDGWQTTLNKMTALGMNATDAEIRGAVEYFARNYPADDLPPINLNKARAIELESGLSLRRSQAADIIAYREKNGPFKSVEDLRKIPSIDFTKIETKKDRLTV